MNAVLVHLNVSRGILFPLSCSLSNPSKRTEDMACDLFQGDCDAEAASCHVIIVAV